MPLHHGQVLSRREQKIAVCAVAHCVVAIPCGRRRRNSLLLYSGAAAMVQVGDPTYAADTLSFHRWTSTNQSTHA